MISGALLQAFFATIFLGTKKNTDAPREEAFSIPLKSVDVVRHTQTHWDIQQEHKIDELHFSEELKPLMAFYLQDAVQKGEAPVSRLKEMVRSSVAQKITNNNLNARNEDCSLQGAAE